MSTRGGDRAQGLGLDGVAGCRDGDDNIVVSTDYPHSDSTWPESKKVGQKLMGNLPDDVVRKLVRGNAIEMLQLPFAP